jgi:ketosteroid isomerase-like protein
MSEENVEVVRRFIDAFNRQDRDGALRLLAATFEYDASRAVGPWRGVHSLNQMPRLFDDLIQASESNRYEADEFIESGEKVVTPFTNYLRGRDGIEVQAQGVFVWRIKEGLISNMWFFPEQREALEAAGLSE